MEPIQGQEVIVYDRYLFEVPMTGIIQHISRDTGALMVKFHTPITKHSFRYFYREQCRGINGELFYDWTGVKTDENHSD